MCGRPAPGEASSDCRRTSFSCLERKTSLDLFLGERWSHCMDPVFLLLSQMPHLTEIRLKHIDIRTDVQFTGHTERHPLLALTCAGLTQAPLYNLGSNSSPPDCTGAPNHWAVPFSSHCYVYSSIDFISVGNFFLRYHLEVVTWATNCFLKGLKQFIGKYERVLLASIFINTWHCSHSFLPS